MKTLMPVKKDFWTFIQRIRAEQTAKEIEQNQIMINEAVIVPLTKLQKTRERTLARYKLRYLGGEYTPLQYVERIAIHL